MRLTIVFLLMHSCASIPEGSLQIRKRLIESKIANKMALRQQGSNDKTRYVKAYIYPRLLTGGDIVKGSEILIRLNAKKAIVTEAGYK